MDILQVDENYESPAESSPPPKKRQTVMVGGIHSTSSSTTEACSKPRTNYIDFDEYFMSVAFLSAQQSKDPNSQVGACITNSENKIVGIGYNGMPNGCKDSELPWGRAEDWLDSKYPYVCHAELNAVLNKNSSDVKGCKIFVSLFPCNECAKVIIQTGIREVVYYSDKYRNKPEVVASKKLLNLAGVTYRQYIPKKRQITIDFTSIDPDVHPTRN